MDAWDEVRKKIAEMEDSFLASSPELRSTLDTVSVADFWKRRYEEERQIWEQKLALKEREQHTVQEKFLRDEEGIRELNFRIREMEQKLAAEKQLFEERAKLKALETELEKKRVEWETRIRTLENENEELRARIRKGNEQTDEEARRRQQTEAEKTRMETELKLLQQQIQTAALEENRRMQALAAEKERIQEQLAALKTARTGDAGKSETVERELAALKEERAKRLTLIEEREKEQLLVFEDLTRGFAHKVRNYLGIVSGTLQLCLTNFKMEPELKEQITLVDQNAQEMLKIIEEFLALAKIPEMTLQNTNLNELISNVLFALEETAKAQNVRFEKKLSDPLPPVALDAKLFGDALRNLLQNAVEASASGSVVTVSTESSPASGLVVLRVADTGRGIPENHLKKIYQPYFTTKKGKKGLGLTIAKRAVDLHHGSISLASVRDRGTTVTIELPFAKSAAS